MRSLLSSRQQLTDYSIWQIIECKVEDVAICIRNYADKEHYPWDYALIYPVNEIWKQFAGGDKMLRQRNNIESCGGSDCFMMPNIQWCFDLYGSDDLDAYTLISELRNTLLSMNIACQENYIF